MSHTRIFKSLNLGFTLIELLIVVAIIAILAAIAVPNFLEAQTRSKVSRVKADERSIAVAMESYATDYNTHPYGVIPGMFNGPLQGGFLPEWLTTPVAYTTSLPIDRFNVFYMGGNNSIVQVQENHPWTRYRINIRKMLTWGPNPSKLNGTYANAFGGWNNYYDWWAFGICKPLGITEVTPFYICSPGPDKREETWPAYAPNTYDPSNGTVSRGDVTYLGGGGFK